MKYYLLLVFATAIWGFGFIATKWSLYLYDPYWANTIRFFIACLASIPFFLVNKTYRRSLDYFLPAFIAGALIFLGMHFQTLGLKYTSVAKSGFLTAFYVIFIPIISIFFLRRRYSLTFWFYVLTALLGVGFLCDLQWTGFNKGDFYTLLCGLAFAIHILYIDKITHRYNSFELNGLQFSACLLIGIPASLFFEGSPNLAALVLDQNRLALYGLLFLGLLSSVVAFSIQLIAQKKISPHIAGFFFLLESPFAAVFGFYVLDERLSLLQIFGCLLILYSVVAVQKSPKKNRNRQVGN